MIIEREMGEGFDEDRAKKEGKEKRTIMSVLEVLRMHFKVTYHIYNSEVP
jgi:hypothetical protein